MLGGTGALSAAVAQRIDDLGYHPVRLGGPDRFHTAVLISEALPETEGVLIATGLNFAATASPQLRLLPNGSSPSRRRSRAALPVPAADYMRDDAGPDAVVFLYGGTGRPARMRWPMRWSTP